MSSSSPPSWLPKLNFAHPNGSSTRMQSQLCEPGLGERDSYIHCLPFDILCIIFELCGSPPSSSFGSPYPFDDQFGILDVVGDHLWPWALGQTCRYWREIVLHLRSLWSIIDVNLDERNGMAAIREQETNFHRVQICLQRSLQSPLYLRFKRSIEPITSCKVLDLLMSHSQRWYDVELYLPSSLSPSLVFIKDRIPILRNLTYGNRSPYQMARNFTDTFMSAPSLRRIKMLNIGPKNFQVDWLKIRDYTGSTIDGDFNIFLAAPNLVRCTLSWVKYRWSANILPLTQLRALSFMIDGRLMNRLDLLILPVLQDLRITIYILLEGGFDGISSLIQRSSCTLEALHLDYNPIRIPGSRSVIRLFDAMPKLKKLTMVGRETIFDDEIIQRLVFQGGAQPDILLPLLETLGFIIYDKEPSNMERLISMLRSRRIFPCLSSNGAEPRLTPLREIKLYGHTVHLSATAIAKLTTLASSGLDIAIQPNYSSTPPS